MKTLIKPIPYDYSTTRNVMYQLKDRYPFLNIRSIGKSVLGKQLLCFVFGKREQYVLMTASFHGREWITTPLLLLFAEQLADAIQNRGEVSGIQARRAFFDRGLIVVPMVNPDGVDISIFGESACPQNTIPYRKLCGGDYAKWCSNGRGVDINHNFDAGWTILHEMELDAGIVGPAMSRYGGTRPESEPETKALADVCRHLDIAHVMALHTQGEEIYWRYGNKTPEKSRRMANIFAASSGYCLKEAEGIASHGGFKDWFIHEFGRPGFTVEVGKGESPLPIEQLYSLYARLEELFMLTLIM